MLLCAIGGQLKREHHVPMLKLLGGLQRLAQLNLIFEEQHLGRLLPALGIAKGERERDYQGISRYAYGLNLHFHRATQTDIVLCGRLHAEQRKLAINMLQVTWQRAAYAIDHDGITGGQHQPRFESSGI